MPQNKNFWNIAATVGALLIAFLAVLTVKEIKSIAYVGRDVPITDTISVNGTGDATSVPDIATFSFSVTENASTVVAAQNAATTKVDAALKGVRDAGVADTDIKTDSYTINPHYDYQNGTCSTNGICMPSKSVMNGYDVSETIEVKIRDLDKAGAIFSTIGSTGVENLNGLDFTIDDINAVQDKARSAAIADAQSKAQELAKELGVTIVGVASFTDSSNQPGPIMYGIASNAMDVKAVPAAAPQIPTGQQKVTSNVTITYEIR